MVIYKKSDDQVNNIKNAKSQGKRLWIPHHIIIGP